MADSKNPSQTSVIAAASSTSVQSESSAEGDADYYLQFLSSADDMKAYVKPMLKTSEQLSDEDVWQPYPRGHDFIDVICGWEATVATPTYIVSPTVAKKRKSKTNIIDEERRAAKTMASASHFPDTLRSAIVERDTYRYIPGNGRYRLSKDRKKLGNVIRVETNYTFMPKRTSLTIEQRQMQRQFNRDMRRDFADRKVDEFPDELSDEEEPAATANGENDAGGNLPPPNAYAPSFVRTGTKDFRQRKKEKTIVPASDTNLLSKAFTDRIMKNFSSKISALEDQIRGEANWWAVAAGGAQHYAVEKKSDRRSNSLPLDTIRIVPVNTRAPLTLKPLDRLPQRHIEGKYSSLLANGPHSVTNPTNTPRYSVLDSYILNPLNLEAARPKPSKSDTHIHKARKPRRTSVKNQIPTTDDQSNGSGDNSKDDSFQSASVGKPHPREKKIDITNESDLVVSPNVALPELFGKKLEVTVAAQKWL